MKIQASKEQQDVIDSDDVIVVSNPGTGKTATLSLRVIKLLGDGVKPEDILCITFTNKARKEMFDAIYDAGRGMFSDAELVRVNIHTFHSLAYGYLADAGMIQHNATTPGLMRFSILNSIEKNHMFNYEKEYIITDLVPKLENAIKYIKSLGITPAKINIAESCAALAKSYSQSQTYSSDEMSALLKHFVQMYREYESFKGNAMDYTDMLLAFREKFQSVKFEHVLVDEMQDMNEMEADIVRMTAKNLFLVGDPKQAIFGFQGGSVRNFARFRDVCELKLLSENRRSTRQILDYSKEYFLENTGNPDGVKRELEEFTSRYTGMIPRIISTDSLLPRVLDVIESNSDKSVGVITRTNRQLAQISEFLEANGREYSSTSLQVQGRYAKDEMLRFIRGLLSCDVRDKILAAFTVFSPYTLQEAFEFSREYRTGNHLRLASITSWGARMCRSDLDEMFDKMILPVCVSKGPEWLATAASVRDAIDQYLALGIPELDGMLDFVAVSEESDMEHNGKSNVMLTTIHKAKGRAFDVVVYVPNLSRKTSLVDRLAEAILVASGADVMAELGEEPLRADFVAFTRAREQLVIIGKDSDVKNYHMRELSELETGDSADERVMVRSDYRLAEAYSLFVAGRYSESKRVLETRDDWLGQYIRDYFEGVDHFSYSGIVTTPYDFLTRNIIRVPYRGAAMEFGSQLHDAMRDILTDKTDIKMYDGKLKKAVQNGLAAIDSLKEEYPGLELVSVEEDQNVPLSSMTDYEGDPMMFKGILDAVFVHGERHLIVDYKTDKRADKKSRHKMQLAAYRRMLSVSKKVPEEHIDTCIVFPAISGGINMDKLEWKVITDTKNAYPKFEAALQKILEWKRDPEKYIAELLDSKSNTRLFSIIREMLTRSGR